MGQQAAANPTPRQGPVVTPDRQLFHLRFSPCGKFLAAGGQDALVRRWEVGEATTLSARPSFTGHQGWVQALAFHPDRRRLFTADSYGDIRVWAYAEPATNALRVTTNAHDGWIRDLAISADGKLLASCGRDKRVVLWSTEDGRKLHESAEHDDDVYCVAFHPDNKSLISGDLHGRVKQWDVGNLRKTREFDCKVLHQYARLQDLGGVRCLIFDAAGKTLVCAGGKPSIGNCVPTMLVFEWDSGKLQHTMSVGDASSGFVFDVAFHPAGFLMGVTSGQPGNGKFFFHRPGQPTPFFLNTSMPNCHSLAVHPDGKRLLVSATNGGSNGNGRPLKNGEYAGNVSPMHFWTL